MAILRPIIPDSMIEPLITMPLFDFESQKYVSVCSFHIVVIKLSGLTKKKWLYLLEHDYWEVFRIEFLAKYKNLSFNF